MPAILKQHEGSLVSPRDDAVLNFQFNDQNGIIKGCKITHVNTNQIRVEDGYAYICGRLVQIEEETVISQFASQTGASGELILKLDILSDTPARLIARTPRQELVQEDINGEGTVYEYLLATYTITDIKITELAIAYETVSSGFSKEKILKTKEEINAVTEYGFLADAMALKDFFQSASNGKALIASAITGKGVSTDASASFVTMANNIKKIPVPPKVLTGQFNVETKAGETATVQVVFSPPFGTVPRIYLTTANTLPSGADDKWVKEVLNLTRGGCTVKVTNDNDFGIGSYIMWRAEAQ